MLTAVKSIFPRWVLCREGFNKPQTEQLVCTSVCTSPALCLSARRWLSLTTLRASYWMHGSARHRGGWSWLFPVVQLWGWQGSAGGVLFGKYVQVWVHCSHAKFQFRGPLTREASVDINCGRCKGTRRGADAAGLLDMRSALGGLPCTGRDSMEGRKRAVGSFRC